MANIGTLTDNEESMVVTGILGVSDNDVVIQVDNVLRFNEFAVTTKTGIVDVDVTLDGTNYITAIALEDKKSTTPQTRVTATVAAGLYRFFGTVMGIRVIQKGATAAVDTILTCGKIGR